MFAYWIGGPARYVHSWFHVGVAINLQDLYLAYDVLNPQRKE
jgi:hypothetical protein